MLIYLTFLTFICTFYSNGISQDIVETLRALVAFSDPLKRVFRFYASNSSAGAVFLLCTFYFLRYRLGFAAETLFDFDLFLIFIDVMYPNLTASAEYTRFALDARLRSFAFDSNRMAALFVDFASACDAFDGHSSSASSSSSSAMSPAHASSPKSTSAPSQSSAAIARQPSASSPPSSSLSSSASSASIQPYPNTATFGVFGSLLDQRGLTLSQFVQLILRLADAGVGDRDDESDGVASGSGGLSNASSYSLARRSEDDEFGSGGAAKVTQTLHSRVLKLCLKHVFKYCCRAQPAQLRSLLCNQGALRTVSCSLCCFSISNVFQSLGMPTLFLSHSDARCVFEVHEYALARIFHHFSSLFVAAPIPAGGRRMPSSSPTASSSSSSVDSSFTFANRTAKASSISTAPTSVGVSISLKQFHAMLTVRLFFICRI